MVTLTGNQITFTTSFSVETLPRLYRALVTLVKETAEYCKESGAGENMDAISTVCHLLDEILPMEGQVYLLPDGLQVVNNTIQGEATKGHPANVLLNLQKSAKPAAASDYVTKSELTAILNQANQTH